MQVLHFFYTKFPYFFDISHAFLPQTIAKLSPRIYGLFLADSG